MTALKRVVLPTLGKPTKPACNIVRDQSNGKSRSFHKRGRWVVRELDFVRVRASGCEESLDHSEFASLEDRKTKVSTLLSRRGLLGTGPFAADHIGSLAGFLAARSSQSLTEINLVLLIIQTITIIRRMAGRSSTDDAVTVKRLFL